MSPRSLFIIILRVLGILTLKELLIAVPQLLSTIVMFFQGYSMSGGLFMIFVSLVLLAIILWVAYMLLFKTGVIITTLGLDQGFAESTLNLSISAVSVYRIAIIVTGALLLVSEIPNLCQIVYSLLQRGRLDFLPDGSPDWSPAVFSGVKILLALLLIGERKRIIQLLEKSANTEQKEDIDKDLKTSD